MLKNLLYILNYPLFCVEHAPITPAHLLAFSVVMFAGILLARFVGRLIEHRMSAVNAGISLHSLMIARRIGFYSCLVVTSYVALRILHVPLTAVHFMAGGLAVGIGFGFKDLLNNLVSGLIIMFERPVRIGDVIDFQGEIGKVTEIGLRCTCIHTEDNVDIFVPNSALLNGRIANWTLKDCMILTWVPIGISYKADVKVAVDIMLAAVGATHGVLDEPAPFALFKQHGESALIFHLYFAIRIHNKMERWEMESRVNYALNKALRDHGIKVPYPQLDVHLANKTSAV